MKRLATVYYRMRASPVSWGIGKLRMGCTGGAAKRHNFSRITGGHSPKSRSYVPQFPNDPGSPQSGLAYTISMHRIFGIHLYKQLKAHVKTTIDDCAKIQKQFFSPNTDRLVGHGPGDDVPQMLSPILPSDVAYTGEKN